MMISFILKLLNKSYSISKVVKNVLNRIYINSFKTLILMF